MKGISRLTSKQRRQTIVEAVRAVFAEKGFDGTTTRELAKAAGVSEALIYKHFPSKQSLYAAMLDACAKGPAFAEFNRILALKPSTSTLVIMVHFAVSYYVERETADPNKAAMNCLIARSLLEDGEFVRLTHKKFARAWIAKFEACLRQALRAKDLRRSPVRPALTVWFVQHLGFSLMLHLHPKKPVVNYSASNEELIEQATWFGLLGIGLKEEAIRRHYNPAALALLAG